MVLTVTLLMIYFSLHFSRAQRINNPNLFGVPTGDQQPLPRVPDFRPVTQCTRFDAPFCPSYVETFRELLMTQGCGHTKFRFAWAYCCNALKTSGCQKPSVAAIPSRSPSASRNPNTGWASPSRNQQFRDPGVQESQLNLLGNTKPPASRSENAVVANKNDGSLSQKHQISDDLMARRYAALKEYRNGHEVENVPAVPLQQPKDKPRTRRPRPRPRPRPTNKPKTTKLTTTTTTRPTTTRFRPRPRPRPQTTTPVQTTRTIVTTPKTTTSQTTRTTKPTTTTAKTPTITTQRLELTTTAQSIAPTVDEYYYFEYPDAGTITDDYYAYNYNYDESVLSVN